jgi:hypothetical protein
MYLVRCGLPVMHSVVVSLLMRTRVNGCLRILISVREVQSMKSMGTFICYHQYYGTICTDRLCVPCSKG